MLDQNRAVAQLSDKLEKKASLIDRVIIWGNHSTTQVADYSFALVEGNPVKI